MTKFKNLNTIYFIAGLALVLGGYYLTTRYSSWSGSNEDFFGMGTDDDSDSDGDGDSDSAGDSKATNIINKSIKEGNKQILSILEKIKSSQDLNKNKASITSSFQALDTLNKALVILQHKSGSMF